MDATISATTPEPAESFGPTPFPACFHAGGTGLATPALIADKPFYRQLEGQYLDLDSRITAQISKLVNRFQESVSQCDQVDTIGILAHSLIASAKEGLSKGYLTEQQITDLIDAPMGSTEQRDAVSVIQYASEARFSDPLSRLISEIKLQHGNGLSPHVVNWAESEWMASLETSDDTRYLRITRPVWLTILEIDLNEVPVPLARLIYPLIDTLAFWAYKRIDSEFFRSESNPVRDLVFAPDSIDRSAVISLVALFNEQSADINNRTDEQDYAFLEAFKTAFNPDEDDMQEAEYWREGGLTSAIYQELVLWSAVNGTWIGSTPNDKHVSEIINRIEHQLETWGQQQHPIVSHPLVEKFRIASSLCEQIDCTVKPWEHAQTNSEDGFYGVLGSSSIVSLCGTEGVVGEAYREQGEYINQDDEAECLTLDAADPHFITILQNITLAEYALIAIAS